MACSRKPAANKVVVCKDSANFPHIVATIPREAFREAMANALIHRAWDVRGSIKVSMFADRIEVTSLGGLPDGVTEEEYRAGDPSVARNPILANIFFRLGYIERFGTGIPRIVEAYSATNVSPRFTVRAESVTVVLPVVDAVSLSGEESLLLRRIPKGTRMSRAEIADAAGKQKTGAGISAHPQGRPPERPTHRGAAVGLPGSRRARPGCGPELPAVGHEHELCLRSAPARGGHDAADEGWRQSSEAPHQGTGNAHSRWGAAAHGNLTACRKRRDRALPNAHARCRREGDRPNKETPLCYLQGLGFSLVFVGPAGFVVPAP